MSQSYAKFVASSKFIALCSGIMVLYMYGWLTRWTFDPSARGTDYFFSAQADSLLNGHLWVNSASFTWAHECLYVGGKCYGYFGLTPSFLRIPFLLIAGPTTQSFATVLIPLATGVAFGASLDLCRQFAKTIAEQQRGVVFMFVAALTLGPGSVLVLLADPYVYQEAIAWSIAGVMLAVNFFWRWSQSGKSRYLNLAILFCIFATGARPTTFAVGAVLGISIFVVRRKQLSPGINDAIASMCFIVLPTLFSFGVLFAKFGQPSPPPDGYRNPTGVVVEKSKLPCNLPLDNHPKYVPTNLLAYLRPDAVRIYRDWPNVRFRFNGCIGPNHPTYLWPLKPGDMYVEKTTSLSNTMPIPLVAVGFGFFQAFRQKRPKELILLVAVATSGLLVTMTIGMTSRYLGDFYPLLASGLAISATVLGSAKRKSVLVVLTCIAIGLTLWSLLANASLLTRYGITN